LNLPFTHLQWEKSDVRFEKISQDHTNSDTAHPIHFKPELRVCMEPNRVSETE